MLLNLRCAVCDQVKESNQDTEELVNVDPEDICPACFICDECSDGNAEIEIMHEHLGGHDAA